MKLKKFIPVLSVISLGATPIVFTSCNTKSGSDTEKKDWEIDAGEYADYIYSRSFSIMAKDTHYASYGTGWIMSDATPDDTTDYKYYLATNWHVIAGFEALTNPTFHYADKSLASPGQSIVDIKNYATFNSFRITEASQFMYDEFSAYYVPVIDFYVAEVDFGNQVSGEIKNKLDKLNEVQRSKGYINKFVTSEEEFKQGNKYVGGYPRKKTSTLSGGQWEVHGIKNSALRFFEKDHVFLGQIPGHKAEENSNYYDVSPQLSLNANAGLDFMSGGASGSMLIDDQFRVCGIYWGGWVAQSTMFSPSFSYFKDFIKGKYTI